MNTDLHFSSKTPEWSTPQKFFDELDREFNFTLDTASNHENAKCKKHYTVEDNGLLQDWNNENVFCNPPYGRDMALWVKKSAEAKGGAVVLFIPARPDTRYFHEYIYGKAEIRFLKGRIRFEINGKSGDAAPFPSMLTIFRNK